MRKCGGARASHNYLFNCICIIISVYLLILFGIFCRYLSESAQRVHYNQFGIFASIKLKLNVITEYPVQTIFS